MDCTLSEINKIFIHISGITSILALSRVVLNNPSSQPKPRFAIKVFNVLNVSLGIIAYAIGCWTGPARLKKIISVLKETQKVAFENNTFA